MTLVAVAIRTSTAAAPARCAQMISVSHSKGLVARLGDWMFGKLARGYSRGLDLALRAPVAVLIFAAAVLFIVSGDGHWPGEMVPTQDQSRIQVRLTTTIGGADLPRPTG